MLPTSSAQLPVSHPLVAPHAQLTKAPLDAGQLLELETRRVTVHTALLQAGSKLLRDYESWLATAPPLRVGAGVGDVATNRPPPGRGATQPSREEGKLQKAMQIFQRCHKLEPSDPEAPYRLAQCCALRRPPDRERGLRWLREAESRGMPPQLAMDATLASIMQE
eukprot:COSAG01_NODE_7276_length_3274_cov_1.740787_3_plen_165_part_00